VNIDTGPSVSDVERAVSETFPNIHWEVWSEWKWDGHKASKIVRGAVDGWQYGLGIYRYSGDETYVCRHMIGCLSALSEASPKASGTQSSAEQA
jgi:hypothetical protein